MQEMMMQQASVRRSISCYSLRGLGSDGDSCHTEPGFGRDEEEERAEERRGLVESMRAKRQSLNDALNDKLAELRALCLKESEITGELPIEFPLLPNEALPTIRRKMRTEFSLNDKLLAEPKTEEETELAKLELQIDIQEKIVEATEKLMREVSNKRAILKHRKRNVEQAKAKLTLLREELKRLKEKIKEENKSRYLAKKQMKQHLSPLTSSASPHHHHQLHNHQLQQLMQQQQQHQKHFQQNGRSTSIQVVEHQDPHPHPHPHPMSNLMSSMNKRMRRKKPALSSSTSLSVPSSPHMSRSHVSTSTMEDTENIPLMHQVPRPLTPPSILEDRLTDLPSLKNQSAGKASSLENVRRKSYIHAVNSPPSQPQLRGGNYYNNHQHQFSRTLPKNPPPPVPHTFHPAHRPLPPPPTVCNDRESSPSDLVMMVEGDGHHNYQQMGSSQQIGNQPPSRDRSRPTTPLIRSRPVTPQLLIERNNSISNGRDKILSEISSKGVRSSVVRTPVAIAISTTTSADAQIPSSPIPSHKGLAPSTMSTARLRSSTSSVNMNQPPSRPVPTPPLPQSPLSSTPPSFSSGIHSQLSASSLASDVTMVSSNSSLSMGPPLSLPPRKPKKSMSKPPTPLPQNNNNNEQVFESSHPLTPIPTKGSMNPFPPTGSNTTHHHSCSTANLNINTHHPDQNEEIENVFFNPINPSSTPSIISSGGRSNLVETPRPDPIQISPSVPMTNGQVDVLSVGTYTPYWEETKPFELSDFFKYSRKHQSKSKLPAVNSSSSLKPTHPTSSTSLQSGASEFQSNRDRILNQSGTSNGMYHAASATSFISTGSNDCTMIDGDSNGHHPMGNHQRNQSTASINSNVSADFKNEMLDWYEEKVKSGTVV